MDHISELRSIATLVSLACFIGIIAWAFSKANRAGFDEAANLPFEDEQAGGSKH